VKVTINYLAYALIIAMARDNGDSKYKSYSKGRGLTKPVEYILEASGVILFNGGAFKLFGSFRSTFRTTKLLCSMV